MTDPNSKPSDVVTASELVRHFGIWQERAARSPVYVMFRGRPRLVLASVETMEPLLVPYPPDRASNGLDTTSLFDLIRDMVIVAGADLRIAAASRTARAYFAEAVAIGTIADAIVPAPSRSVLHRTLRHVQATGVTQTLDLPSPRTGTRLLTLTMEPHRRGVALLAVDQG